VRRKTPSRVILAVLLCVVEHRALAIGNTYFTAPLWAGTGDATSMTSATRTPAIPAAQCAASHVKQYLDGKPPPGPSNVTVELIPSCDESADETTPGLPTPTPCAAAWPAGTSYTCSYPAPTPTTTPAALSAHDHATCACTTPDKTGVGYRQSCAVLVSLPAPTLVFCRVAINPECHHAGCVRASFMTLDGGGVVHAVVHMKYED
jgi:hypothetical protein